MPVFCFPSLNLKDSLSPLFKTPLHYWLLLYTDDWRLWEDPTAAFQYVKGSYKKEEDRLFSRVCCDRTRGNGFKLKEGRFRLGIRKKFFTIKMMRLWNRLPGEVVEAASLQTIKVWRNLSRQDKPRSWVQREVQWEDDPQHTTLHKGICLVCTLLAIKIYLLLLEGKCLTTKVLPSPPGPRGVD